MTPPSSRPPEPIDPARGPLDPSAEDPDPELAAAHRWNFRLWLLCALLIVAVGLLNFFVGCVTR